MNIGLNITRYYVKYAYVLIKSILENNTEEEIHFYIYSVNIKTPDLDLICKLVEKCNGTVELISVNMELIKEIFDKPMQPPLESHTSYFQIHSLPDEVDRILIMDADMIVKKSLREFYEMDFENNYVICVDGACINQEIIHFLDKFAEMNVTPFSTVITLYNVKKIKEDFSFKDILQANHIALERFNHSNEEFGYGVLFNGKELYVPETKYGFYVSPQNERKYSEEELSEYAKEAVAIHYFKSHPWEPEIGMLPIQAYWWEYAKDTPYYEEFRKDFWSYWKKFRSKLLTDMTVPDLFAYKFPWNQIKAGEEIFIYGAGEVGKRQIHQIHLTGYSSVKAAIDKNADKLSVIEDVPVISIKRLKEIYHGEKIVVGNVREKVRIEIKNCLIANGIPEESIVWDYEVE